MLKRAIDVAASLCGLVLFSPVMLLCAAAVWLDGGLPIFFAQQRVGRNFRKFPIYKFRSMVVNAPTLGAAITAGRDPRITRVGGFLRASKLDELPQLWNVLVGDMSVVGPRPEVPKYVDMFPADYEVILQVRPGITDPASIKFRDESTVLGASSDPERTYVEEILPEKIRMAKEYAANRSLGRDLMLIFQTAVKIVRK